MELCGKSCESCTWKEMLGCPGCQAGPGRPISGDCEVASCCRSKGHASCETCGFVSNCQTRRRREHLPEERLRRREEETARQAQLAQDAPVLAMWLRPMFWLVVPGIAASILSNETLMAAFPTVQVVGNWLNVLVLLLYGVLLWKLAPVWHRYRTAAWCNLAVAAGNGITLLAGLEEGSGLMTLLGLAVCVPSLVGTYQEYTAHAEVLEGLDNDLSGKWRMLWKWEIGLLAGTLGCILPALISAILGLLALLVCAIGLIVVSVLQLVYLYRTAKVFREYHGLELPEVTK